MFINFPRSTLNKVKKTLINCTTELPLHSDNGLKVEMVAGVPAPKNWGTPFSPTRAQWPLGALGCHAILSQDLTLKKHFFRSMILHGVPKCTFLGAVPKKGGIFPGPQSHTPCMGVQPWKMVFQFGATSHWKGWSK